MVFRKHNSTAGFSLIEVLVAITILGFVAVPIGSSLVRAFELNARSEQMLQAQLAVSSAVETLMAEGYKKDITDRYDNFSVYIKKNTDYEGAAHLIDVEVKDSTDNPDIWFSFSTYVRPAPTPAPAPEGTEGGGD